MLKSIYAVLAGAAMLSGAVSAFHPGRPIRVATGYTSHMLCSAAFISGVDPGEVYAEAIQSDPGIRFLSWALRYRIDRQRRQVTATVAGGFESRAIFREGLGCLVVHGAEPAVEAPRKSDADGGQAAASLLPEIAGPSEVEPANEKLRAALDRAFADPGHSPQGWVKAVVVLHDGRVVAERYAKGYGVETPLLGWSVTKSVTNALIGILVREGKVSIAQPAPVPAWSGSNDPRHAVTVDELLRMTSGLAIDETNSGLDAWSQTLYLEPDIAGHVESAGLEAAPGSRWSYTSANTMILSRMIRDTAGGTSADVLRFAHRELFDPLGMHSVTLEFDATGTPVGSSYMFASARDWARFGMLYLKDGVAGGQRILPEGWVRYSSTRTLDSPYAAGFWLGRREWREHWGLPEDSFFAAGSLGQRVVVVPSRRLVIVRFGVTHARDGDQAGLGRLVADVMAAVKE